MYVYILRWAESGAVREAFNSIAYIVPISLVVWGEQYVLYCALIEPAQQEALSWPNDGHECPFYQYACQFTVVSSGRFFKRHMYIII